MNLRLLSIALFIIPSAAFSAPAKNLHQEYEQVREIALRDPKVKAAFVKANRVLEEKIVEIDPALKDYGKGQTITTTRVNDPAKPKAAVKPSKSKTPTVHTIAEGDTLSTIAAKYHVTVAELKAANPTVDEKKLQVTEKLNIPAH